MINEREAFEDWAFQNIENFIDVHRDGEYYVMKPNSRLKQRDKEFLVLSSNRGWASWKACKAQAVPEGYCLVPAELYNFQANHLAEEEFKQNKSLFDMEHRGLSGIEMELRQAKWLVYKAESIKENYRRLVKWASESGAEG